MKVKMHGFILIFHLPILSLDIFTFLFVASSLVILVPAVILGRCQGIRLLHYRVGHSIGAHASGLAALHMQKIFGGEKIFRITGLDSAGPLFYPPISARNLRKEDAFFVDVIHTNMGQLGDKTEDGHADYYPNGGVSQPGCKLHDTGLSDYTQFGTCSHRFSYHLYAASFTKSFPSCQCGQFQNVWLFQRCISKCPTTSVPLGLYCPARRRWDSTT